MGTAAQLADSSGDMEQRRKGLEEMLSLYRELVKEYPLHEKARLGLAQAQISLATLCMDGNDYITADSLLKESKDILYVLADTAPHRLSFRQWLSTAYYTIGTMNNRQAIAEKDEKEQQTLNSQAQAAYEQCINIAQELENMDRDNAEYPFQQCKTMAHMADIAMRRNEYHKAEHYSRNALNRINILLEMAPNNADYAQIRAGLMRNLALVHTRQESEKAKATAEFAEYREIIRTLLKQSPNNPMLKYMYADALAESAAHAKDMGDATTARRWLQEAEMFLNKLSPNGKQNQLWSDKLKSVQDMLKDITAPVNQ